MAPNPSFGTTVVIDGRKLAELLRSPQGGVARKLFTDGEKVKQEARRLVGVYQPPDAYSAANRKRRPGTLRDSIVKRLVSDGQGLSVLVGSNDPVALWHHEGTRPHVIRARARPRLVFFWQKAGRVVAFKQVNHPGTKPNRFLVKALRVLGTIGR